MSSISEFERSKPTEAYKKLNSLISKYRALYNMSDPDEDVCSSQAINLILSGLALRGSRAELVLTFGEVIGIAIILLFLIRHT